LRSAQEIWEAALGELQLQVNKPNYDTWLRDTTGIAYQDRLFVVGVPNVFIAEWLANRLYSLIRRTLAGITGTHVDVEFLIQVPSLPDTCAARTCEADGGTSSKSKQLPQAPGLNPRYTFSTFVTGEPNRLAYAAALEVAEAPGQTYNPLFVYGDTGVGKTHLLHAIGHAMKARRYRVLYVNAEQFTNQFVIALKNKKAEDFHRKFRAADVLLVDDIQFLTGKPQTQESFFHLFNDLYDNNCQIVVTSDHAPKALSPMTKRLRSRLEWGLIVDIQPLDLETRLIILDAKVRWLKAPVSSEVLQFLARRFQHNVRELEGALNRVITYAKLTGEALDVHLATKAVQDLLPSDSRQETFVPPHRIMDAVASYYGVPLQGLTGKRRDKKTALARQVAMYLLREQNHSSLADIGRILGGRDHTTVLHGYDKIASEVSIDPELSNSLERIRQDLGATRYRG